MPPSADAAAAKAAKLRARLAAAADPGRRFKLAIKLAKAEAAVGRGEEGWWRRSVASSRWRATASPSPSPQAGLGAARSPHASLTLPKHTPASGESIRAPPGETAAVRAARAARFETGATAGAAAPGAALAPTLRDARAAGGSGFGTSAALEKSYFRLTAPPRQGDVRPPSVLRAALDHVTKAWAGGAGYGWACEQLKSVRQDVTVQGLRCGLAVAAYQAHARIGERAWAGCFGWSFIECGGRGERTLRVCSETCPYNICPSTLLLSALQAGDLAEFNQCATALVSLHAEQGEKAGGGKAARKKRASGGGGGGAAAPPSSSSRPAAAPEFAAYRLLYAAVTGAGLAAALRGVDARDAATPAVCAALAAVAAARAGDAAALRAARDAVPGDGGRLVDALLPAARAATARRVAAAFRPALPLADAARWLGMADDEEGAADAMRAAGARVEGGVVVVAAAAPARAPAPAPAPPRPEPSSKKKRKHGPHPAHARAKRGRE